MSKQFGKTWWGSQWLNSLTHIDFDNRLPRGSAYAKKGAVTMICIENNMIHAKVKGSRPKPYDITIVIPPFFEKDIKALITAIAEKPVVISKLLNRELDPEILSIAERIGLKVFPRQWSDFKMVCNCPDWAVPCKHLAAVIYKVSAEIDNNPFLVFSLHKVDLVEELARANIHISTENTNVAMLRDLLKTETDTGEPLTNKSKNKNTRCDTINYSNLSSISDALIQLLSDAPVFYQNSGNFRDKYAVFLHKAERNGLRILKGKASLGDYLPPPSGQNPGIGKHTLISIVPDANGTAAILIDGKKTKHTLPQVI
ncbi:MAG: SWIM zinc finger family protein, partial [Prevotella sp.]|nr:SWIM zinc finger family protein [Prevotella sp.]